MKNRNTAEQFVSISEASRRMKRSRSTLHSWIRSGLKVHTGGKVSMPEVQAYAAMKRPGPRLPHLRKLAREAQVPSADPVTVQRTELEAVLSALESGEGADGLLARLRHVEKSAFRLLAEAQRAGDPAAESLRGKLHVDAAAATLRCAAMIDERAGLEQAAFDRMKQAYTEWSLQVRAVLDAMPRMLAPRCNITDPAAAEVVLIEWQSQFYAVLNTDPDREKPTSKPTEENTDAKTIPTVH